MSAGSGPAHRWSPLSKPAQDASSPKTSSHRPRRPETRRPARVRSCTARRYRSPHTSSRRPHPLHQAQRTGQRRIGRAVRDHQGRRVAFAKKSKNRIPAPCIISARLRRDITPHTRDPRLLSTTTVRRSPAGSVGHRQRSRVAVDRTAAAPGAPAAPRLVDNAIPPDNPHGAARRGRWLPQSGSEVETVTASVTSVSTSLSGRLSRSRHRGPCRPRSR